MLETFTAETFKPHLNENFIVEFAPYGKQELELISIDDRSNKFSETFSLIFSGSPSKLLPQQIHHFTHLNLGEMQLFITPVQTSTPKTIHYQAVFNRLIN